jgi:tRNA pseudouridine55 synthase
VRLSSHCQITIAELPIFLNGVLIIDKPAGLTSHDVVNRVRRISQQKSVGHLGTLDPLATGVLPLVLGSFTRLAQFYNSSEKTYEGQIRFGFATDTYDAQGQATTPAQQVPLSLDVLRSLAIQFRGIIEQTPPPFSAKKVDGVPAYKMARKHQEVQLRPVQVEVKEFEITGCEAEVATFRARVASGTYMRAVAHEMGKRLGCGAHLASLRRSAVAEFSLADALTLEKLVSSVEVQPLEELFVHPRRLLPEMPSVTATEENIVLIRNGRAVNLPDLSRARQIKVFANQKELIAIAQRVAGTLFHPKIVLAAERARAVRY